MVMLTIFGADTSLYRPIQLVHIIEAPGGFPSQQDLRVPPPTHPCAGDPSCLLVKCALHLGDVIL